MLKTRWQEFFFPFLSLGWQEKRSVGLAPRVSNLGNLVEHSRSVALLLLRNGSYFSLSLSIVSFVVEGNSTG